MRSISPFIECPISLFFTPVGIPSVQAISLSLDTPNVNIMKTTEYTHIRVSKELHAILKSEAEARGISIANYIDELQSSIKSIKALVSSDSDVNIDNIAQSTKNPSKTLNLKNLDSPERIRTSVTGSKGQYA